MAGDEAAMASAKRRALYLGWKGCDESRDVERILADEFELMFAEHFAFGDRPDQRALAAYRADFLFSFGPIIVRRRLLCSVLVGAINFHTAPPRWPGRGSCSWALYAGDSEFGVTAHLMEEEVDAGPILRVLRFPIEPNASAETLHLETLRHIPRLVTAVVSDLRKNDWTPVPNGVQWERKALTQQDLMALMEVGVQDSPEEMERKIRAFAHSQKPGPYVNLNGRRFWFLGGTARHT